MTQKTKYLPKKYFIGREEESYRGYELLHIISNIKAERTKRIKRIVLSIFLILLCAFAGYLWSLPW